MEIGNENISESEFLEIISDSQKAGFYLGFAAGQKNKEVKSLSEIDKIMNELMSELITKTDSYIPFEEI